MGDSQVTMAIQSSSSHSSTEMIVWSLGLLVFSEVRQSTNTRSVRIIRIYSLMNHLPERKLMKSLRFHLLIP